jgi:hypothetical protein
MELLGGLLRDSNIQPIVHFLTCPEGDKPAWGARHVLVSFANFLLCQELVSQQMTGIALRQRSF